MNNAWFRHTLHIANLPYINHIFATWSNNQWTIIWCHNDVICPSPECPHEAQSLLSFSLPNQLQHMFLKKSKWLLKFISYSCLVACQLCHETTPNIELHNNPNNHPKWVYHLPRQQLCRAAKVADLKKNTMNMSIDGKVTVATRWRSNLRAQLRFHPMPTPLVSPSFLSASSPPSLLPHPPHLSPSLVASSPSVSIIRIP